MEPQYPQRKQLRLKGYDYSLGGICFLTVCVHNRQLLFGEISAGEMQLNAAGHAVKDVWLSLPETNPGLVLDLFVVMPNHFHALIALIDAPVSVTGIPPDVRISVPDVVRMFKTLVIKEYGDGVRNKGWPTYDRQLWQRSYWEWIVRSESELESYREYIWNNPLQWELDEMNSPQ